MNCLANLSHLVSHFFLVLFSLFPLSYLPSLKMEIEKLANEKTEMQRHYVMVSSSKVLLPPLPPSPLFCLAHNKQTLTLALI